MQLYLFSDAIYEHVHLFGRSSHVSAIHCQLMLRNKKSLGLAKASRMLPALPTGLEFGLIEPRQHIGLRVEKLLQ